MPEWLEVDDGTANPAAGVAVPAEAGDGLESLNEGLDMDERKK